MSLINLRLRGPAGVSTIQIAPDATFFELQASIFSATSIAPEKQQIRSGHPPRPLTTADGSTATVVTLGIKNGDVLVVQEGDSSQASTSSTTIKSPPPSSNRLLDSGSPAVPAAASEGKPSIATTSANNANHKPSAPPASSSTSSQIQGRGPVQPARNSRPQQPTGLPPGTALTKPKPGLASTEDAQVKVDGGWMVLRVVPDDNSCMFTSLAILLEHDKHGSIQRLRETVADEIRADPFTWSEPVLGMQPDRYCQRIIKPETWGGAIELAILSKKYQVEIDSVDVQTGRVDRFGEEHKYENHILLVYSGIHYDAVTFTPLERDGPESYPYALDFDQAIFSRDTEGFALAATTELARKLRDRHYYTDVAGFALRCEVCKTALKGEKEAQEHAKKTGHTNFGEFS